MSTANTRSASIRTGAIVVQALQSPTETFTFSTSAVGSNTISSPPADPSSSTPVAPFSTSSIGTSSSPGPLKKLNTSAIAGGVVGGVIVLATVFCLIQRRSNNRRKAWVKLGGSFSQRPYHLRYSPSGFSSFNHATCTDPTPFVDPTPPSSDFDVQVSHGDTREHQVWMIGQKESLERQLTEAQQRASQAKGSKSRTKATQGSGSQGTTGESNQVGESDDAVQALRHEVDILTRKIATLEAGMAPPDYSSGAGSTISAPSSRIV
ncbi:hypothetical protein L218DRAFT_999082 [Marasmius fiardii PR-910]|nr:hypothetical protein L218DRAFT_999082 [Marasmius fiardii PR-910]